jgi:V8-like Glu-specific endopeptidase
MKVSIINALTTVIFYSTIGSQALALPTVSSKQELPTPPSSFTTNYNFEGIVALNNCSGSIIRFEQSRDTDHAMVLTNGHCLEGGFPAAGTFVYQKDSSRRFRVLDANAQPIGTIQATKIIYSTMTKTDITLYQVQETYAEILEKYKTHPFTLSSQHPSENTPIEVISGFWKRGYSCSIETFIPQIKEDAFTWTDSVRYSRPGCEVIGGTSGSPIILQGSKTVIAINNTINESGESCTMNNPCEVDSKGNVSATKGVGYGQETYWIYSCLNSDLALDLSISGCQLFH